MATIDGRWFYGVLTAAVVSTATAAVMKVEYNNAKSTIASLTTERDALKGQNAGLMEQLKRLVDPASLNQCQNQLATVRANKNDAIQQALRDLKAQQDEDAKTMKALMVKKWSGKDGMVGLSEADQVTYATASQRWTKYTDDRSTLLKQLVCVP